MQKLDNSFDQMIFSRVPRETFDTEALNNCMFTFDLENFYQALENLKTFKSFLGTDVLIIDEEDLNFGLFVLYSSESILLLRPLPILEQHLDDILLYFQQKKKSTGIIEEILFPTLIEVNYTPLLNVRKNSHFQTQGVCQRSKANRF